MDFLTSPSSSFISACLSQCMWGMFSKVSQVAEMLQATQERTVIVSGPPRAVSLAVRALYDKLLTLPPEARCIT